MRIAYLEVVGLFASYRVVSPRLNADKLCGVGLRLPKAKNGKILAPGHIKRKGMTVSLKSYLVSCAEEYHRVVTVDFLLAELILAVRIRIGEIIVGLAEIVVEAYPGNLLLIIELNCVILDILTVFGRNNNRPR